MGRDFSDETALIIGGSSGIGAALGNLLGAAHTRVLAVGRRSQGPSYAAEYLSSDLADKQNSTVLSDWLRSQGSELDILVQSAGVMSAGPVEDLSDADLETMVETNLSVVIRTTRDLLPLLKNNVERKGRADLVIVGSISASSPVGGRAAYAASKAGIKAFVEALRYELVGTGVRLTYIEPGLTKTGLRRDFSQEQTAAANAFMQPADEGTPIPSLEADDIAEVLMAALRLRPGAAMTQVKVEPY